MIQQSFLLLLLFNMALLNTGLSQSNGMSTNAVNKEKMKAFQSWIGHWQGTGEVRMGPGEPKKSNVNEYIEFKLDNTILTAEGIGKSTDAANQEKVTHHAFGVISYDLTSGEYKFNSYLEDGKSTAAWFTVLGNGRYQWGFDAGPGKIRYSITVDSTQKTWNEIGEYSGDSGSTWQKFFEMNLKKVE